MTKAAVCTADGVKTFTCTVCGEEKTEAIPALGHTVVTDEAVAPTCTEDGRSEGSHCSVCGEVIKAQEILPAGHMFCATIVQPTCTEDGALSETCLRCGYSRSTTIRARHEISHVEEQPATCGEAGVREHYECSVCGKLFADPEGKTEIKNQVIRATGEHQFGDWEVVHEASETEMGQETRACSVCRKREVRYIAPGGILLGDVDFDGSVTSADARLALRRAVGLESFENGSRTFIAADMDLDGEVTAEDARLILRNAVGLGLDV